MANPFGDSARHLAPEATAARQSVPPVAPAPDGKAAVEDHFGWAYRHFARELPGRSSDGGAPTTATGAAAGRDGEKPITVASVVRAYSAACLASARWRSVSVERPGRYV